MNDMDDLRTLPHNIEAEQSVLGALLIGAAHHIDEVAEILQPRDFYRPAHQIIYGAILNLHGAGEPVDEVTVLAELDRAKESGRMGGGPYLHPLAAAVPTAANVGYYARLVKDCERMRTLVQVGTRIARYGYEGDPSEADAMVARAHEDLIDRSAEGDGETTTLASTFVAMLDRLESPTSEPLVPVPYQDVNALLGGGLRPGQLVVIAARPAVGKTTMALDVARSAAIRHDMPVYLASKEMSNDELTQRIAAAEGRISFHALKTGELTPDGWDRLAKVMPRISEFGENLVLDDRAGGSIDQLRAGLRRMAQRGRPARLLVLDYIQLMEGTTRSESRQQEVAGLSRALKLLAKEFRIPVIALSQLNRQSEQRTDKRPVLSDLRDSGAIEQDSDIVILLHREDTYNKESPRAGEADVMVVKHRGGPTATITVAFQGHYSRFVDMARDPHIPRASGAADLRLAASDQ
ncbi:replicative DNA helicase [Microbispora sp. CSR-4]|uniref:replicative DNA helicase n=1 Tax=Microbispora sp. CSR-4 TaxID=2592813 RepID=UPI0011CA4B4F|nr:replicative DNA helicase [Microbispora sp. CSR-4]